MLLEKSNTNSEGLDRVPCNCRRKEEYLWDGQCNSVNVVYLVCISAIERSKNGERDYIGISTGNWK